MKSICVVGTGYVGLVTGACFAEMGHRVSCIDNDEAKMAALKEGVIPIYEPDLPSLVQRNMEAGRLSVTSSFHEGLKGADFVFITVGTPAVEGNKVDLSYLHLAYMSIGAALNGNHPIIVNKSTIPPGTSDMMEFILSRTYNGKGPLAVVANPEFLREGHAVQDFMHPSRVVVGARDPAAAEAVADLYRPLDCPIVITDTRTAEMVKYTSNAFLAMKVSFINEIASICDKIGVDVTEVARGVGLDPRIGKDFLGAGIGYGGSCLPKDIGVLCQFAQAYGLEPRLLNAVIQVNQQQPRRLVQRLKQALGRLEGTRVGVLGLAFKAGTDDVRFSPALELIRLLQEEGARVSASDPQACRTPRSLPGGVTYLADPYQVALGADAVVLATDWPQYRALDLQRLKSLMRGTVLVDARNALEPEQVRKAGLQYLGMGRGSRSQALGETEEAGQCFWTRRYVEAEIDKNGVQSDRIPGLG